MINQWYFNDDTTILYPGFGIILYMFLIATIRHRKVHHNLRRWWKVSQVGNHQPSHGRHGQVYLWYRWSINIRQANYWRYVKIHWLISVRYCDDILTTSQKPFFFCIKIIHPSKRVGPWKTTTHCNEFRQFCNAMRVLQLCRSYAAHVNT